MPTIVTHPLIALTKTWFPRLPRGAVLLGAIGSILPDADVAAFAFGIPYAHMFGHRGFSHSIVFALLFALAATAVVRGRFATFAFVFLCTMSHALLDAMTDGGLGIAFFSPFSNERHFLPWTPIRVSPLGAGFFSARGIETLMSEVVWVWVPLGVIALLGLFGVRQRLPRE
ncbi:MAG TPA: metal-dependent hydrolase [Thermoanaerobaculia bacterium]|jgi:inner membrane protein|nr:metal-dependent hydrolase [Thermoanaerobaculia bacterium]